jgi:hypothetical protein
MESITKPTPLKTLLSWVGEAQSAHSEWRKKSWQDWEFRDGVQWSQEAYNGLIDKGINPLTINRVFPILNLIYGHFLRNQQDVVAKGRTSEDNELAQTMSEALAVVRDQNRGNELVASAFNDEIVAGFGCVQVGKNPDPRCEPVQWRRQPWYSMWWDPYASPWFDKETCRYVFTSAWKNLEDVIQMFPEKKRELMEHFAHLTSDYSMPHIEDEQGTLIEEYHRYLSSGQWVNSDRKRVRPVQMWYTVITKGWFAIMPDSRVIDLDTLPSPNEQIEVVKCSEELLTAYVKKIRVATFISDLLLDDVPSPYAHDAYPFVPFVGYLDRFNCPFGVPRQVKEQSMEVNKRRSMALALISSRRVITEEGAARDLNKAYSEANRHNGMVVLNKGKLERFRIEEMGALAPPQIDLMHQSEREIQEIIGANDEALGKESKLQSGVALEKKELAAATVTASLLDNAKASQKRLGELTLAMIQSEWTGPKVLRVVDRLSGAEKFVEVNQKVYDTETGAIVVKNNIVEGRFDVVISAAPITDTMREKNMEVLFSAINKAPPEAIGPLLNAAFEISDIPGKDHLLRQIRAVTGVQEFDNDLSTEEQEMLAKQKAAAKAEQEAEQAELDKQERMASMEEKQAKIIKLRTDAEVAKQKADREDWQAGVDAAQKLSEEKLNDTATRSKV